MDIASKLRLVVAGAWLVLLAACGGGGEPPPPVAATAPNITLQPLNQQLVAGGTAVFAVTATGTAPLAYQWRRNGNAIAGATAATYSLTAALGDDSATFSVMVSNAAGSAISESATLTVISVAAAPTITAQPQGLSRTGGQLATFNVTADGAGPLAYQWQRNGADLVDQTRANLTVVAMTVDDGASFRVLVRNAGGSVTSSAATLTVASAGAGTLNGISMSTTAGSAWLPVTATVPGRPAATSTSVQSFNIPGVTASEHVVLRTAAIGHLDQIKVAAVRAGAVSLVRSWLWTPGAAATLDAATGGTVNAAGSAAQVTFPVNAFARADNGAPPTGIVTVTLTPLPGALDPNWLPGNGAAIGSGEFVYPDSLGAIAVSAVDATAQPLRLAVGKLATVRIPLSTRDTSATPASATVYWMNEHDALWVARSTGALAGSGNAQYFEALVSDLGTMQAAVASEVVFVNGCTAFGSNRTRNRSVRTEGIDYTFAAHAYTGSNGEFSVAIRKNSRAVLFATGGTETTAPIVVGPSASDITLADCLQERGNITTAPSYVVQPQSLSVAAAARVRLHVVVDGRIPIALQWRRNGVAIPGETGTALSFIASASDNGAIYTLVATNSAGSTASTAATLAVTASTGANQALNVSKAGTGSGTVTSSPGGVECGSTCSATFAFGTAVFITAAAASGSTFAGWSGDCTGQSPNVGLAMTAPRSCVATFNLSSAGGAGTSDECTDPNWAVTGHRVVRRYQSFTSTLEAASHVIGPTVRNGEAAIEIRDRSTWLDGPATGQTSDVTTFSRQDGVDHKTFAMQTVSVAAATTTTMTQEMSPYLLFPGGMTAGQTRSHTYTRTVAVNGGTPQVTSITDMYRFNGFESITVPAGTFDTACSWTVTQQGAVTNFWLSGGSGILLKVQGADELLSATIDGVPVVP